MIVKNSLLNYSNTYIYQNSDWFCFSLDSVLLANFVNLRFSDKLILDFCTGNAPIPMLLTYRTSVKIYGVEIQREVYDLAIRSVCENKMNEQIKIFLNDVKDLKGIFSGDMFDVITCNPPFFPISNEVGHVNDNLVKRNARHEILISLDDILQQAKFLLRNGGTFAMVHRPERFVEIIEKMKKNNIEPKRVRFVYPKMGSESNILLIEGVKNGKTGLKVLAPLYVHDSDGNYLEEIIRMFGN